MRVIEQFTESKSGDEALNDDKIVITSDFIAVIDGATSRQGQKLRGMSSGRFAAHVLAAEIAQLPPDITALKAAAYLTEKLRAQSLGAAKDEGQELASLTQWPAAAAAIYSRVRREIWRVADPTVVIDGVASYVSFPQEDNWAKLRQSIIKGRLVQGATEDELRDNDPAWEVLTPVIGVLKVFSNCADPRAQPYAYGVFNGHPIPEKLVEVFDVREAKEIILASDGYPEVLGTLSQTESALCDVLSQDPLMYKIHPQVKGVKRGAQSFDDRTYVRFTP